MATTARLSVAQRLVTDAWCALALALLALILLAAASTSEAAPQGPWSLPAIDLSAAEDEAKGYQIRHHRYNSTADSCLVALQRNQPHHSGGRAPGRGRFRTSRRPQHAGIRTHSRRTSRSAPTAAPRRSGSTRRLRIRSSGRRAARRKTWLRAVNSGFGAGRQGPGPADRDGRRRHGDCGVDPDPGREQHGSGLDPAAGRWLRFGGRPL